MSAAQCGVCFLEFHSENAFDVHRGINKKRAYGTGNGEDDLRQDLGRCRNAKEMSTNGLNYYNGKWGLPEDISLARRMESMRAARGK